MTTYEEDEEFDRQYKRDEKNLEKIQKELMKIDEVLKCNL